MDQKSNFDSSILGESGQVCYATLQTMVLILDGNSEIGVHVWSIIDNLIF